VVTVTGTTPVTNTATRTASTPGDFDPANDSASAVVTGSTTPGLPNNGVPVAAYPDRPMGWPGWLVLGLCVGAAAALTWRRRRQ
jgi:hypothetical protein